MGPGPGGYAEWMTRYTRGRPLRPRRCALLAALVALAVLLPGTAVAGTRPLPDGAVVRLAAGDRYGTAVAISQATFTPRVPLVVVATGYGYADALAGGPAAGLLGGPLLLVHPNAIPPAVARELTRLDPEDILVLGGTSAVSPGVEAQLRSFTDGRVDRVSGADRYATAATLVRGLWAGEGGDVLLASGADFPDALSAAAAAGAIGAPVLLARRDAVPAATVDALRAVGPARVVLLGGEGVLSPAVEAQLRSALPGLEVSRVAGADRYATSGGIAQAIWQPSAPTVYLAVGSNFPDALGGAPSAIVNDAPLLLTGRTCAPAGTYAALQALRPTKIVLLGGEAVLSSGAATRRC